MNRQERIGRLFPAPLVGLSILLVGLILVTPILLSNGQPAAGTILTQAELIVDQVTGSNVTHFYVRAVGATVRYSVISIEFATNFSWTGGFPGGLLNWSLGANATDSLALLFATTANPVAVNVSALYQVAGGSALYLGRLAFEVAPGSGGAYLTPVSGSPVVPVGGPTPVSDLPLTIPLAYVGSGP